MATDDHRAGNAVPELRALVVNFNSPEMGYLASRLARAGLLQRYVRPYANKARAWERVLGAAPFAGTLYSRTLGRRLIVDAALRSLTTEAGVLSDFSAAIVGRSPVVSRRVKHQWQLELHERIRLSVTRRAAKELDGANAVIAYTGFAIEAFDHVQNLSRGITALNYPIAHHAHHRQMHAEELEREPEFMETWPSLDHWSRAYEEQVDAEIERADVILVGSSYARDTFTAAGIAADRIRVVPYGVDLETFGRSSGTPEAPRSDSTFRVIYAGQISQRKGLSYLMKGYGAFRKPDSQLTLVGTPPGPTNALARYSHLFTHVPHLTRPELAARYRESNVFVFPTLVEGMPLVVLEAMAAGLPVIVTPHGPNDLVRDGVDGFVVPIRDPEAIHDRLERLYREPDLRRAMGESARQRAQEYSWDVYARRVEQLLQDMLSSRILGH